MGIHIIKTVIDNHDFFFLIKIVKIVVGDHNFKFKPKTNILSSNFKSCECSIFFKNYFD